MARRIRAAAGGFVLALGLFGGTAPALTRDRLDQFRELASSRLALAQLGRADLEDVRAAELYALVDDEIVENLDSGGPFASTAFIQERLDSFSGAWGGASFRLVRVAGGAGRPPLTIGVFALADVIGSGSVRLYGKSGGAFGLLRTTTHDGVPEVSAWPATRSGAAQFVATWLGPASARGSRPLRVDLWRQRVDADAERVWSSGEAVPDGLLVSDFAVRPAEIFVRYELRYPGWKPGCEGQTEHEDLYRWVPASETVTLARRHVVNAWHRELQTAVTRFFAALAGGDRRSLLELVPDPRLRSRLPAGLRPEPACEAQNPDAPGTVVVAAAEERAAPGGTATAMPRSGEALPSREPHAGAPWSLWWSRAGAGWRLGAAAPVLQ